MKDLDQQRLFPQFQSFSAPLVTFDHTQLPPLIDIIDPDERRSAVEHMSWDGVRVMNKRAWGGDQAIDLTLSNMLDEDAQTAYQVFWIRGDIAANKTFAWLALHYRLLELLEGGTQHAWTQRQLATAFEAWIGAAFRDHLKRHDLQTFHEWLMAVFNLKLWKPSADKLWRMQNVPPPQRPLFGQRLLDEIERNRPVPLDPDTPRFKAVVYPGDPAPLATPAFSGATPGRAQSSARPSSSTERDAATIRELRNEVRSLRTQLEAVQIDRSTVSDLPTSHRKHHYGPRKVAASARSSLRARRTNFGLRRAMSTMSGGQ